MNIIYWKPVAILINGLVIPIEYPVKVHSLNDINSVEAALFPTFIYTTVVA